ncbi:protein similar to transforming growth factor-induced protein (and secreted protein MPB70) [Rubellimicrobium mesophilum DSM 19309]|uniref:Protein similar to transforming growth factor-induced protein (And secreted protein MPB70) n=1 Tax=Rubellimicrobium mesophilum DSM 19309 TaxID=442562 RepID=A0A017HTD0_9RHOB|nr:fasciclin domain-containing protein [Rubellimicrobium mesophilum]EYD77636.1 protein similar to transforming growth factor-induced protein (and secreted protein MPB70) [Rubellimicrobium mesophilum DSM 19309]
MKTLLSAVALAALAVPAFAQMANPMVGGAPMYADKTIVENAVNSADHTTLVAAVQAAGLVDTLSGAGPFTVLAPTNEAFAALPADTLAALMQPQNKDRLTQILTCHVIPAEAFSSDIVGMIQADGGTHAIQTVGGCVLQASLQNGMVAITDEQGRTAHVTIADVDQSNGVIHVIDQVLLPSVASQQ